MLSISSLNVSLSFRHVFLSLAQLYVDGNLVYACLTSKERKSSITVDTASKNDAVSNPSGSSMSALSMSGMPMTIINASPMAQNMVPMMMAQPMVPMMSNHHQMVTMAVPLQAQMPMGMGMGMGLTVASMGNYVNSAGYPTYPAFQISNNNSNSSGNSSQQIMWQPYH